MRSLPASGAPAGQDAEERGLAGAVRADDADDAALRQIEREVVVQQIVAVRLLQSLGLDDQVAQTRAGRDVDLVGLVAGLEFLRLQLVEPGHARLALGMAALRVGAHPFQLVLHGLDAGLLLLLLQLQALLLLLQPGGIVALPGDAVAAVELQDPAGDIVEEVAIMGDGDDGAGILVQEALEPGDRFGVEMVGRLVEQQHVGLGQQQPAERDAATLPARELGDVGIPGREAQGVGGDLERALQIVSVGGLDQVLELGLLLRQGIEVRIRLGIGRIDRVEPLQGALIWPSASSTLPRTSLVASSPGLLRQKADLDAGLRTRLALDLGIETGHDLQQGRFARAVQPEHADLGAGEKGQEMSRRMTRLGGTILPTRFIVKIY
jgi:hypothetical protein